MTTTPAPGTRPTGTPRTRGRLRRLLTDEVAAGTLLLLAAALGLGWANSPWRETYHALSGAVVGPASLHLDLTLAQWASDGLLALFFLVVGLELKQELVAGSLRDPRRAAVPALAAVGGMVAPAAVYVAVVLAAGDRAALPGWAIPTATDIAFALAVLAVFGRGLPVALRTFLLTLAVVDDLLAVVVIAAFYTEALHPGPLALAVAAVAAFALLVRGPRALRPLLPVVGVLAWALMHASGVHATIAGVLLGLVVPAGSCDPATSAGPGRAVPSAGGSLAPATVRYERALRPWSSGLALPVFAFFAAGVTLVSGAGPRAVLVQPVVAAVVAGLVLGKVIGVLGATALVTRASRLRLPDGVGLRDLLPVGLLAGIGFTVSLLVAELSFPDGPHTAGAKAAILLGSLLAATAGAVTLRRDARQARDPDMNHDGVPDRVASVIGDDPGQDLAPVVSGATPGAASAPAPDAAPGTAG